MDSLNIKLVEEAVFNGIRRRFINLNVQPVEDVVSYDQIEVESSKWNYEGIVDSLVQYKYPNDKMQAVINNYLLEPENPEYIIAFNEMQLWRKEAKEIAKKALSYKLL